MRDTGAVGARILIDPRPHVSSTNSPAAQSNYAEFAKVFSQLLGCKITYVPVTIEQRANGARFLIRGERRLPCTLVEARRKPCP